MTKQEHKTRSFITPHSISHLLQSVCNLYAPSLLLNLWQAFLWQRCNIMVADLTKLVFIKWGSILSSSVKVRQSLENCRISCSCEMKDMIFSKHVTCYILTCVTLLMIRTHFVWSCFLSGLVCKVHLRFTEQSNEG